MRKIAKKFINYFCKSPISSTLLLSVFISLFYSIIENIKYHRIDDIIMLSILIFAYVLPAILTIENIIFLIQFIFYHYLFL